MKILKNYSALCVVMSLYSFSLFGMLINKKSVSNLPVARKHNFCSKQEMNHYGLVTATMPQRSKGALGNFRLDKQYGVRDYLAQYIAFNKKVSLHSACWEDFSAIEKAYKQFLNHNSSTAIQISLNNNVIDADYALQALYFTHKVVTQLQKHIEYNQEFAHHYVNDPEQYIWVDDDAFNPSRRQLLYGIEREQKEIRKLVDFLQQKPVNKMYTIKSSGGVFEKKESLDYGWTFTLQLPAAENRITPLKNDDVKLFALLGVEPAAIAQTWDGILGNFALSKKQNGKAKCTIQDYLCKYIARNLHIPEEVVASEATFIDIKKAFELFVNHNHPEAILRDFENEVITKEHAKDALTFTFWVVNAFEKYLENLHDDSHEIELFELFWQINRMREKSSGMRFVGKNEWSSVTRE